MRLRSTLLAAGLASLVVGTAASAHAQWYDPGEGWRRHEAREEARREAWRAHEWQERRWREHEWRERHGAYDAPRPYPPPRAYW